jgi:hypothetical protein
MEVLERHARTRAITRDTPSPANQPVRTDLHASLDVARVVSDVSVLCPRAVDGADNSPVPPVTYKRLARLKRVHDQTNFFRLNPNIQPG